MKTAFITGITGQDGAYLARFLIEKGYTVHGLLRRTSTSNTQRLECLIGLDHPALQLHYGDMTDMCSLVRLVAHIKPDEVYNLAAQSHVAVSFETAEYTAQADAIGTLRLLEAIRTAQLEKHTKFYQASTSELYGDVVHTPQNETTPFRPQSPYATAKLYAYWITTNYRTAYDMFTCNGILFNHESEFRGSHFVTKKITEGVARIAHGSTASIKLGNLNARRDWGYAPEYVEAMWLMLQQEKPQDFVIATGQCHSIREFATTAFAYAHITVEWHGSHAEEIGVDATTGNILVQVCPSLYRPNEVHLLQGDSTKAQHELGWQPRMRFAELVRIMVDHDMRMYRAKNAMTSRDVNSQQHVNYEL